MTAESLNKSETISQKIYKLAIDSTLKENEQAVIIDRELKRISEKLDINTDLLLVCAIPSESIKNISSKRDFFALTLSEHFETGPDYNTHVYGRYAWGGEKFKTPPAYIIYDKRKCDTGKTKSAAYVIPPNIPVDSAVLAVIQIEYNK